MTLTGLAWIAWPSWQWLWPVLNNMLTPRAVRTKDSSGASPKIFWFSADQTHMSTTSIYYVQVPNKAAYNYFVEI